MVRDVRLKLLTFVKSVGSKNKMLPPPAGKKASLTEERLNSTGYFGVLFFEFQNEYVFPPHT